MDYHKITRADCLSMADEWEVGYLGNINNIGLLEYLAEQWCKKNGYKLGGYLGGDKWDATK